MTSVQHVVIIFNPNSTGDSPQLARDFADELRQKAAISDIQLKETKRAGHGRDIAYEAATSLHEVLIVSVSGDGGYNDVINGVMQAADEGKEGAICAVLPGGNANDHYTSTHERPLVEALLSGDITKIDLLRIEFSGKKQYAHSYAGLGLTPLVAVELNRHSLSTVKEAWLAVKTFRTFRPFEVDIDGNTRRFDSMVFANIDHMAKYLNVAPDSEVDDGTFEIIAWPHTSKMRLIVHLVKTAFKHGVQPDRAHSFAFTVSKPMPMQLDGEISELRPGDTVRVTCERQRLRTIL